MNWLEMYVADGVIMNWLEMYVAAWLTRRIVRQGYHTRKITQLFMMVRAQVTFEFTEDNDPTREHFLRECFEEAMQAKESK